MKLNIDNWRWAGVPFYIRAAKRLQTRVTEVVITFKQPPLHMFKASADADEKQLEANVLTLRIQPEDGISLKFGAKIPGPTTNLAQVKMNFSYADVFGKSSANGYERLLRDHPDQLDDRTTDADLARMARGRGITDFVSGLTDAQAVAFATRLAGGSGLLWTSGAL